MSGKESTQQKSLSSFLLNDVLPESRASLQTPRLLDLTVIVYLLLLAALIVVFQSRVPHWYFYVAAHGVILLFVLALVRFTEGRESGVWYIVREVYPMVLFTFMFKEISLIINIFFPFWLEPHLIRWDQLLFGEHAVILTEQFFNPILTEVMAFAYWSYYALLPLAAIALLISRKKTLLRSFMFNLTLTMCTCYLSYLLLSARGPQDTLGHLLHGPEPTGLFYGMVLRIQAAASISGAAFPSSHVAAVWVILIFMFRLHRVIGALVAPIIILLTISTVYLQYHYAVDAIAGIVLVAFTYPLASRIERRFNERRNLFPAYASNGQT